MRRTIWAEILSLSGETEVAASCNVLPMFLIKKIQTFCQIIIWAKRFSNQRQRAEIMYWNLCWVARMSTSTRVWATFTRSKQTWIWPTCFNQVRSSASVTKTTVTKYSNTNRRETLLKFRTKYWMLRSLVMTSIWIWSIGVSPTTWLLVSWAACTSGQRRARLWSSCTSTRKITTGPHPYAGPGRVAITWLPERWAVLSNCGTHIPRNCYELTKVMKAELQRFLGLIRTCWARVRKIGPSWIGTCEWKSTTYRV